MEHKIQYINVLRLLKIESLVIKKLQYKLNNQMRHLREFKNLKRIQSISFKLIEESKIQIKSNEPNYHEISEMIQQIIELTQNIIEKKIFDIILIVGLCITEQNKLQCLTTIRDYNKDKTSLSVYLIKYNIRENLL
ncbi:hypothetical protein pb186bvf_013775 [Paramecium bursaria]